MIEAVLFDYGMVLTGPAHPAAWQQMLAITGLADEPFRAAYWAPRHGYDRGTHTGAAYWRLVCEHAGLAATDMQVAALLEADNGLWTQPNQPMIDWAARLQAAGTPTGILSNLGDAMTEGVMQRMPWLNAFTHRTFSHTLKLAKPELAIYRHAAEGLQTAPERILFVDDRADNCEGARAAGLEAIQYLDHGEFVREMHERGYGALWTSGRTDARTTPPVL